MTSSVDLRKLSAMAPLIVLLSATVILLAAGAAGVRRLRPWSVAVRGGLAAMFLVTGVSHFVGMRAELIDMVPPVLPEPSVLVSVTGVLELAGAVGLLLRRTATWAAAGLTTLLVLMFPANIYAATQGLMVNGAPAMDLVPRSLLQLVFLSATSAVLISGIRSRRSAAGADQPISGQESRVHALSR